MSRTAQHDILAMRPDGKDFPHHSSAAAHRKKARSLRESQPVAFDAYFPLFVIASAGIPTASHVAPPHVGVVMFGGGES